MTPASRLASPRLAALASGRIPPAPAAGDELAGTLARLRGPAPAGGSPGGPEVDGTLRCELCAQPIAERHRHLADIGARELRCVCRACSVLFDCREAAGGQYRVVPDRVLALEGFDLPAPLWAALAVPVDMAFFFPDSAAGRVVAFYPGPAGAVESQLGLDRWDELAERNPVLRELDPDVEALLVDRTRGGERYWLVPIDVCYELVALIRAHWKGLAGGSEVWERLAAFFDAVSARARPARGGTRRSVEQAAG